MSHMWRQSVALQCLKVCLWTTSAQYCKCSNFYRIFSIGSAINKPSHDYWQSKPPPSPCMGLLTPSNHFCPDIGSGCVCMSASMSSRGHWTPTLWHKRGHLGAQTAESNWSQEDVHWCNPGVSEYYITNDSGCLQLHVYLSLPLPRHFPTLCTCIILEGKPDVIRGKEHTFP